MLEKIKLHQGAIFFVLTVVLTGTLAFGLGRLSKIEEGKESIKITANTASPVLADKIPVVGVKGSYVASKNGTKYYLLGCAGVQKIKEENKVYFASREAAEKAGLGPAANCPGI